MAIEWVWLLLALPIAFALGWFASRMDWRQFKLRDQHNTQVFSRGLNHLLNEEQDQAIDAFVEAVTHDPEATDLHFALGNLFRQRGDYDRAVRVHEHMLARADLPERERLRAQQALAQDFWTAGLLDRAQSAYEALLDTRLSMPAHVGLLAVFERGRDWQAALNSARKLQIAAKTQTALDDACTAVLAKLHERMAHYLCELAQEPNKPDALALLQEAHALAPDLPRPQVDLARWYSAHDRADSALLAYENLSKNCPQALGLVAVEFAELALSAHATQPTKAQGVQTLLQNAQQANPSVDLVQALALFAADAEAARATYMAHLQHKPSLTAATRWLALERLEHEQFHADVQRALDAAVKPLQRYRCKACGFVSHTHFWRCPGCQSWDSMPTTRVEEQ
jgi:lipopolysaccharide assembly protein B